jgi:hypothetical protein
MYLDYIVGYVNTMYRFKYFIDNGNIAMTLKCTLQQQQKPSKLTLLMFLFSNWWSSQEDFTKFSRKLEGKEKNLGFQV